MPFWQLFASFFSCDGHKNSGKRCRCIYATREWWSGILGFPSSLNKFLQKKFEKNPDFLPLLSNVFSHMCCRRRCGGHIACMRYFFLHNTRTTLLVYPQALANKSKWNFVIFVFDFSSSFKFCPAIVCCLVAGCLILPQNELVHGNGKRMASDQQNL